MTNKWYRSVRILATRFGGLVANIRSAIEATMRIKGSNDYSDERTGTW